MNTEPVMALATTEPRQITFVARILNNPAVKGARLVSVYWMAAVKLAGLGIWKLYSSPPAAVSLILLGLISGGIFIPLGFVEGPFVMGIIGSIIATLSIGPYIAYGSYLLTKLIGSAVHTEAQKMLKPNTVDKS